MQYFFARQCPLRLTAFAASSALVYVLCGQSSAATDAPPYPLFDADVRLSSADLQRYPDAAVPVLVRAERLVQWMDENSVEMVAMVNANGAKGYDNSDAFNAADRYQQRLAPVGVLDPDNSDSVPMLHRWVRKRGLAAIRMTNSQEVATASLRGDTAPALKLWEAANQTGLVVDLADGPNGALAPSDYRRLAQAYPFTRIVLGNAAMTRPSAPDLGIDASWRALAAQKNIYVKFSTLEFDQLDRAGLPARAVLERLVDVFGADHVLWGSSVGSNAGSYRQSIARMLDATAGLAPEQRRAVLHDTGKAIFVRGGTRLAPLDKRPIIAEIDSNGDGCLSHEEWQSAGAPESSYQGLKDANGCARFTNNPPPPGLDSDGEGTLTLAKLKAFDLRLRTAKAAAAASSPAKP